MQTMSFRINDWVTNTQFPGKVFRVVETPTDPTTGQRRGYFWGAHEGSRYALHYDQSIPYDFDEDNQ